MLGEDLSGLDPVLQTFFDSLHGVANNPTSIPSREVLLSDANSLVSRFGIMNQQIEDLRTTINTQLDMITQEVSSIAKSIAELNEGIAVQKGLAGGQPPNDLMDKRNMLVDRLSELVAVNTVEASDGSLNVFIGSGQTLVLGGNASTFGVTRNDFDPSEYEVSFSTSTVSFPISNQLNGGMLGGLLEFRSKILDPAQNALGRIAIALADQINVQHRVGDDLNGVTNVNFFNNIVSTSPKVFDNANNAVGSDTVNVTIDDTGLIQDSDYRLDWDGANFSLTRLKDNTVVATGAALPLAVAADGITVSAAGGASYAAGDSFLIRPVRSGANDIAVSLTDPAGFAAAGNGAFKGDNSNALLLAAMQHNKLMGNGTESYQTAYGKMVASVGVQTSEARVNASAQKALVQRAKEAMSEVSGVNLDEEATNLVKFQQSYQAAARVITVANEVFQSLLGAISR
jgi:flagellar hook-associated protein 1 FlgK